MNDAVPPKPLPPHLTRPAIYTVTSGANVWPWSGSVDRDIRVLDGEPVVFQERMRGGMVMVSVGGRDHVMTKAEWRKLPIWEG